MYPDGTVRITPDLKYRSTAAHASYVNSCTGLTLNAKEVAGLLERMTLTAVPSPNDADEIVVQVPPTRPDILHECDLMEDAATAEISRSQIWQWIHTGSTAQLTDGGERTVTREWVEELTEEEFGRIERTEGDRFDDAREVFTSVALAEDFPDFLTLPAYERFLSAEARRREGSCAQAA